MLIIEKLIMDKPPSLVPSSLSGDAKWALIGLVVMLLVAIILGLVSASKKGDRGGYWRDEDR
jgi:ABC-type dipeptide/oligopeptide/nickel transport system permease component